MNDKLKYSLIVSLYLIVTIGLLVGTFFILKPIRTSNLSKEILKKYETVADGVVRVEEVDFEKGIITEKYDGFDEDNRKVATLYTATNSNTYGSITIVVALSPEGDIIGIDAANVGQTLLVQEIRASINEFNNNISDTYDGVAGATRAKETINEILSAIRLSHGDGEVTPEPEEPKAEIEFVEVVTEGRKYKVTKESVYVGASQGTLSFNIVVASDGKIVSYEELEYGHSGDNFKATAIEFFDGLIGKDINSLTNSELDGTTGSTNSRTAILDLLKDLADFIENEPEDVVVFVEEVEGNKKYKLTKKSTFVGASQGILSFNVLIDEEDKLVSYEIIKYEHSEDNFKATAIEFFDGLVGKDIKTLTNSELDGLTGSTNSRTAILDLLQELADFIKEGE